MKKKHLIYAAIIKNMQNEIHKNTANHISFI